MPNGKIGDHPITDILVHKRRVYSETVDGLILEILKLGGRKELDAQFDWFVEPPKDFEAKLRTIRDRLKINAKTRGWEA